MGLERLVGSGLLLLAACCPAAAGEQRVDDAERVYLISPGDTIDVFVAERPDLSTRVRIPLEGRIIIPGAGAVSFKGQTTTHQPWRSSFLPASGSTEPEGAYPIMTA